MLVRKLKGQSRNFEARRICEDNYILLLKHVFNHMHFIPIQGTVSAAFNRIVPERALFMSCGAKLS